MTTTAEKMGLKEMQNSALQSLKEIESDDSAEETAVAKDSKAAKEIAEILEQATL